RFADFRARALPPGTVPADKLTTSGTTGTSIEVLQTNLVQLWWFAFYLRDLEWCGLDPRGRLAGIRTMEKLTPEMQRQFREGVALRFWNKALEPLIEMGPSYGIDLHQDPRVQLAWLRRMAP